MFDLEGINDPTKDWATPKELSLQSLEYIREAVDYGNLEHVIARIDEVFQPPTAIDTNPLVAEIIEPIRDQIPNEYLEAPTDREQVERISDIMGSIEGIDYDSWRNLDAEGRLAVLQEIENKAAKIEHRPACDVFMADLGNPAYEKGYCQEDYDSNFLVINSQCLQDGSLSEYWESLDTVLHEGRHAYQNYNMLQRGVNSDWEQTAEWKKNMLDGYKTAEWDGFEAYYTQPVEKDARKFAGDIIGLYKDSHGYTV